MLSALAVVSWSPSGWRAAPRGVVPHVRAPVVSASASGADVEVEVAVIGGGPAAYTMAALLSGTHGHEVCLVDPKPDLAWPNNYGSWRVEWEALAKRLDMPELLTDCVGKEWKITDCFFGGSWGMEWDQRSRLDRPYLQVDRAKLKATLTAKAGDLKVLPTSLKAKAIAPNLFDRNVVHDASGSSLTLADGTTVRAKLVVDATGFESRLVTRESELEAGLWKPLPPGFQIAYGFACDIEGDSLGPYDAAAMTLFDYRTDHLEAQVAKAGASGGVRLAKAQAALADAEIRPSFMYVMPEEPVEGEGKGEGKVRAFFEETSLVGRDERRLEFSTLKERALTRLDHLGLKIVPGSVHEEEYCYIPMGGNLPDLSQRIVAVGGAAATVHPSTGYQLCRMLASSTDLASSLSADLKRGAPPDVAAASGYASMWTPSNRFQRDFQVFGGEFLGAQPVDKLRGFFDAFFQLEMDVWGGFLAGWPGLPGNQHHDSWDKRLKFGLALFVKFPPIVALTMMYYAVMFSLEFGGNLLRSFLTPLFGPNLGGVAPIERESLTTRLTATYNVGDEAAKQEALEMLAAGSGDPSPQVALLAEDGMPSASAPAAGGSTMATEVATRAGSATEEPSKESVGA